MNVINEATVNIQLDTNALLKKYFKEIKELKQELAMHNTLANRGRINYDPYTPEEQYIQQNIAKKFLHGVSEDIEYDSVRQSKELFNQCRTLYQKLLGNREFSNDNMKVEGKNTTSNIAYSNKKLTYENDLVGMVFVLC